MLNGTSHSVREVFLYGKSSLLLNVYEASYVACAGKINKQQIIFNISLEVNKNFKTVFSSFLLSDCF